MIIGGIIMLLLVVLVVWALSRMNESFAKTNYQFWSYDPNLYPSEITRSP